MFPLLLSSTSTSLETAASTALGSRKRRSERRPGGPEFFCRPLVFSLPLSMLVVFAAFTYTAAPAISLGANNTVRYFFGSK
jgi:hypothetical protein